MRVCFWLHELGPTSTSVWHKQKDKASFCSQGPLACDNNCRYFHPGFKAFFWQRWQYGHSLQNKQRSRLWGCFLTLISMWGDWISENWDVLIEFTSNRPTEPRHRSRLYFTSNDTFPANSHNRIWITDKAYCLPKLCALSKRMEKACILQTKRPWVTADTGVRRNQILICTCKPGNYIHPLKILALSVGWVNIIVSSVNSWKRIQPIWEVQSPGFEDCMCSQGWAGCTGVGTHTHLTKCGAQLGATGDGCCPGGTHRKKTGIPLQGCQGKPRIRDCLGALSPGWLLPLILFGPQDHSLKLLPFIPLLHSLRLHYSVINSGSQGKGQ